MWQDDILFYNIAEMKSSTEYAGQLLSRFPQALIDQLDVPLPAQFARGCELRFWQMPGQAPTTIHLCALQEDGIALVLFGEHYVKEFPLPKDVITPIEISIDPQFAIHMGVDEQAEDVRYPSTLCRVFLNNQARVTYCGKGALTEAQIAAFGVPVAPTVNTLLPKYMPFTPLFLEDGTRNTQKLRDIACPAGNVPAYTPAPPLEGQCAMQAKKRFLAYGSSITHGAHATSNYLSYLQLVAQNLNCDVMSCGMSGGCTCENAMADYIAAVPDIDFYFLEIGVNMRQRYYVEEFEARLVYLLEKLKGRKVYLTTIYPNRATYFEVENALSSQERAFNEIMRKYAPQYGVQLIEGADILQNPKYLSQDLIHPTPRGHIEMSVQLTKILQGEKTE